MRNFAHQSNYSAIKIMEILTPKQLKTLETHKYSASGTSLADPVLQVVWNWTIKFIPMRVSPNAITLVGIFVNISTSSLLIFHYLNTSEIAPTSVYMINGLGLFVYQTIDALDGKQARRTFTESPLDELMDHACDSVSTVFLSIAAAITLQLAKHPWIMVMFCLTSCITFCFGHWRTYATGTLKFGKFDVTEIQLLPLLYL